MRAGVWSACLAVALWALAAIAGRNPYDMRVHHWELTLAAALVCLFLLLNAASSLRPARPEEGFAALAALGGAVIGIAFVVAELLVGPPQRIGAAPGQVYHPLHSESVGIIFPDVDAASIGTKPPNAVIVQAGNRESVLATGQQLRLRSYVFDVVRWPAAYVSAWSPQHVGQTITQPTGSAFVSPVLLFPDLDTDSLPLDSFSVPALHREVHVKYYPGLPARGIDVPFLQLQVEEENGGVLFGGVTVSGRLLKAAGMQLLFTLGSYPVVTMAPAPDAFMFVAGSCLLAAGIAGYVIMLLLSQMRQRRIA